MEGRIEYIESTQVLPYCAVSYCGHSECTYTCKHYIRRHVLTTDPLHCLHVHSKTLGYTKYGSKLDWSKGLVRKNWNTYDVTSHLCEPVDHRECRRNTTKRLGAYWQVSYRSMRLCIKSSRYAGVWHCLDLLAWAANGGTSVYTPPPFSSAMAV